jgi:GNAT superfamily N-acetyltransferase
VADAGIAFAAATPSDAAEIARLRTEVARDLTRRHGRGHWSSEPTERGVLLGISPTSRTIVARERGAIVGTLRLATKKPWAIDPAYFTPARKPIHLLDMAVAPERQRRGVGRLLCDEARRVVLDWPGDAIRLDAYDAAAGAGPFYEKCGFAARGRVVYRGVPLLYFEWLSPLGSVRNEAR